MLRVEDGYRCMVCEAWFKSVDGLKAHVGHHLGGVPVEEHLKAQGIDPSTVLETEPAGGIKHDQGKMPWHLIPFDALGGIASVLLIGAKKYGPRNWEKGMDWDRPYDAALRHLTAWYMGEAFDPETKCSHLWHAGCNVLFLIAFEMRQIGTDTRPKLLK